MHFWAAGENGAHIHGERVTGGRGAVHEPHQNFALFSHPQFYFVMPHTIILKHFMNT